jgi:hypothetical protein
MGMNEQMRRGIKRLMSFDTDAGTITRALYEDNGRGSPMPTGETMAHTVTCRVSYEGGGVWHRGEWVGGLATDATPYVFAEWNTDIKAEDTLDWRGSRYKVGAVTRPQAGGRAVCLQAPLTEVKE